MRPLTGAVLAALAAGCERRDPPDPTAAQPSAVVAATASASSGADSRRASGSIDAPPFGPWVRCYGGFRPGDVPARDVQRLAMLCGPSLGMRAAWPIAEGVVDDQGPPREHGLTLERGACARVFAASAPGVADLDVELVAPGGAVIVEDAIDDRWPIVPSDRGACVSDGGAYVVRVRARKGKGAYAVQAWVLP